MDHWQLYTTRATRWTCNTGMIVSLFKPLRIHQPSENSDILDQDFSWNQIASALLQMSPRKAPGDDGITTAFYQAALCLPTPKKVSTNPFARALLRKDGDPLNPGDKRGIALINVGLKLVCKVLQMRIERFVETNNLLSYEQAGFRKREECVGQVVSLVDIIQRRQNAGLNTHVYSSISERHLIQSPLVHCYGGCRTWDSPRRTLAFLKALYTSSSARARQDHCYRTHSHPWTTETRTPSEDSCTQTMWQCLLTLSITIGCVDCYRAMGQSVGMQFGVAKCGISFTGHLAPRLDNPLDIRLHGQLVSRVESYKYLGVLIDSKLDHSAWLKQKRSALEHTISALHPVLANHQLTVNYRSRIFSAVVMGKAYYGLELGIRLFTGARLSTAIGPLLVETGIGSLLTRSLVSRVRLLERSVTKRTPINAICSGTDNDVFTLNVQGQLVRSQRWFWSRRTKQLYRNRYWLTPQVRPKTVKQTLVCIDGDSTNMWRLCIAPECQVTGHRIQSGLVPAIQKSRLRLLGRALDPGVENVYTWLRGGVLNGEADLDQRWLDGVTVEHESMGTRHDNRALAARLADFMQVAYRQYQSTLWKYHRDRLVEVG
ncbi:hypothetical protein BASA83_010055 [Batrachochytrium salamandrivorans]|nr:hypothetical protein BASA83_010055 [Batrachochytrium salamandrivorans]